MFIGRRKELNDLQASYDIGKFQCAVIYGRRFIGKTFLAHRFTEDKPAVFFSAQEANDRINLSIFTQKLLSFFGMAGSGVEFSDWSTAFSFLAERAKTQRFVLVMDEFSYVCDTGKDFLSALENAVSGIFANTKLFLILCSSQVAFVEESILNGNNTLSKHITLPIQLSDFDYLETAEMLGDISDEDKVKYYACIGGTPHYLAMVDSELSFEENIRNLYFDVSGYLNDNPTAFHQRELREPAMYGSILYAVASGFTRLNEVMAAIGEEKSKTSKYMKVLTDLNILERSSPFGEDPQVSRKGMYLIANPYYRFWFRFVFGNQSEINCGNVRELIRRILAEDILDEFIETPVFEQICLQYMLRLNDDRKLPFLAADFGKWWGNDGTKREEVDLDIVLGDKSKTKLIVGECKWRNEPASRSDVETWMAKDYLLPSYEDRYYVYFSKTGYTASAKELEKSNPRLKLLSLEDLYQITEDTLF